MPMFNYMVLDESGERVVGRIDAPSRDAAQGYLLEQGYTILTISQIRESRNVEDILARYRPIKLEVLVYFSRQLATMLDAGLSPLIALNALGEQETNPKFKEVIDRLAGDIEAGVPLSEAFAAHPYLFNTWYVSMIRAGEANNNIPAALRELSGQLEKQLRLQRTIKSATTYPKVVLFVAFFIISGLLMTIVPRFAEIFVESVNNTWNPASGRPRPDDSLPGPTQFVLNISHLLYPETDSRDLGWWMQVALRFAALFALMFGAKRLASRILREPGPRRRWDSFKLTAPFRIGPLVRKLAMARFSRTFSTLLRSGVPTTEALDIVADTSGNVVIADAVKQARARLLAGAPMYETLARSGVFPPMVTHMLQSGERAGRPEEMLSRVADFYEEEVELGVKGLTSIIEPLLLVIVGGSIGVIILVTYLPMFKIYELIG